MALLFAMKSHMFHRTTSIYFSFIVYTSWDSYLIKCRKLIIFQKQPPEVFYTKVVLKNIANFTRKDKCRSLFFNKLASLRTASLLKEGLWRRCFPINFEKFWRTPFLHNTPWRLLLVINWRNSMFSTKNQGEITL